MVELFDIVSFGNISFLLSFFCLCNSSTYLSALETCTFQMSISTSIFEIEERCECVLRNGKNIFWHKVLPCYFHLGNFHVRYSLAIVVWYKKYTPTQCEDRCLFICPLMHSNAYQLIVTCAWDPQYIANGTGFISKYEWQNSPHFH